MKPRVLSIAGSDSGGGAGIQADVKTVGILGGHCATALTAVTAQNTTGVSGIELLDPAFVRQQIEAVVFDIGVDAVKTGMLGNAEIARTVAEALRELRLSPAVVDPVLAAESGASLARGSIGSVYMEAIVPLATVFTPNALEAGRLLGTKVASVDDQRAAATAFVKAGAGCAVVKGGHLSGDQAIDVLCHEGELIELAGPRLPSTNTHGTGCTMAAAIAAYLARGEGVVDSVTRAKAFVAKAIAAGLDLGDGPGPVDPFANLEG